MTLGPFMKKHYFLLYDTALVHLLGRALLSKLKGLIHFASNGGLTLEFPDQPKPDLLYFLQSVLNTKKERTPTKVPYFNPGS